MIFNLQKMIRPHLAQMQTYGSMRESVSSEKFILLDANENPFGKFNRYPNSEHLPLRQKLAEINQTETDQIFLGNGSDELIDLVMRIFCEPKEDSILVLNPSFVMYEIYAKMNNLSVEKLNLNSEFQIDKEDFMKAVNTTSSKILFLCSPNNPTGNSIDDLEYFIENFPGIVVVDEAYIEFSPNLSSVQLLENYPNLIVFKTLSKAFGMAGLRIGVGFASAEIAGLFRKFKPPYNISSESQKLALQQLEISEFAENMASIAKEKEKLKTGLSQLKEVIRIYPSDANFFLAEFSDAETVFQKLLNAGILTSLRHPALKNCVRISVGTSAENSALLKVLTELFES